MPAPALLLAAWLLGQADAGLPFDPSHMRGLTDGHGHFVVYNADAPLEGPVYSGDGKTFYAVPMVGGGASGTERFDLSFWDPRVDRARHGMPSVSMRDSGAAFEVDCGGKLTALKPVEFSSLLGAKYLPRRWTRLPHQLLRDDSGVYYFVDRLRDEQHRDFRVFMGRRGALKQLPLKDIVDDSKGTIYATRTGNLRLVANTASYTWVAGKVETKLIDVPVEDNARMIYLDLGPYSGAPLGTPCDDLM